MATEPGRAARASAGRWVAALLALALLSLTACSRAEAGEPEVLVTDAVATPGDDTVAVYAVFDNAGGEDRLRSAALGPGSAGGPAGQVSLHSRLPGSKLKKNALGHSGIGIEVAVGMTTGGMRGTRRTCPAEIAFGLARQFASAS